MTRLQALVKRPGGRGFWNYSYRLRKLGVLLNHKRLGRICQALSWQLSKRRQKKRLPERVKRPLQVPPQPSVCWSLDFMNEACTAGRRLRTLHVVDDWNREVPGSVVDCSLPAPRGVALLTTRARRYGLPTRIRVENGPELRSQVVPTWCQDQHLRLHWISTRQSDPQCLQ